MPVSDPIGDLLTRMRNAQSARSSSCAIPWSRQKEELLKFLQAQEWVKEVSTRGEGNDKECVVMFRDDNH
jgi:small subunit ribosomal protein S8